MVSNKNQSKSVISSVHRSKTREGPMTLAHIQIDSWGDLIRGEWDSFEVPEKMAISQVHCLLPQLEEVGRLCRMLTLSSSPHCYSCSQALISPERILTILWSLPSLTCTFSLQIKPGGGCMPLRSPSNKYWRMSCKGIIATNFMFSSVRAEKYQQGLFFAGLFPSPFPEVVAAKTDP